MSPSRFLPRRFLTVLAALAGPAVVVLALLALGGFIAVAPALIAAGAIVILLGLLVRPHLLQLEAITGYLRKLAGGADDAAGTVPPRPVTGLIRSTSALQQAVADAGRVWARRRRELEALVAANEAVLASLPDPLIMLDRERRIVRANPAAESLFGQALAGRDLTGVLRNPALIEAVDAALGGSGRVVEFSLPVPVERGFTARAEPLARPIADGTVALLTLHDITQVKRTEQMRADFVANASHEMRTPLSTLLGFIETLRGPARDDTAAQERFLAIMHEQALRMSRLVADLLSLSRIELNEHTVPTGRVILADVVHGVADTLQFKAAEKRMTIELDAPPPAGTDGGNGRLESLPPVTGDPDELAQVFQNLIDNAIKYGRPGSRIRIAGWTTEPAPAAITAGTPLPPRRLDRRGVAVAVIDEGEGIAREHLPRLTERFYRVDTARSRDLGGTGLGLAIVKHILNRHRGALDIDSAPGEGSTFTVFLPAAAPPGGPA
jgi:two-component system phosphate regulon sensor histidine kinase PhoR